MSDETFVDKQMRLLVEQQAVDLFGFLHQPPLHRFDFTVLVMDYNNDDASGGHTAVKSTLSKPAFVATIEALLASWSGGPVRFAPPGISTELLRFLAAAAREALSAGFGYALLIGNADSLSYVAKVERASMKALLEELLPTWRAEAKGD